ncbi:hypothetical protein EUA06_01630 [Nocardioides glacieisoli]|uniref:WD40 repeat domain-containing protein n=1 Tax=Nocardioides glacieisoli TaxID=1168730 RepID=A0A4Q2S4R8_9ACTN|nr:hypothetical protein [Nocardioides glacieisoli]RYB96306.1 hypothetical protein EUA06_01630 [Nocardioides glacieisoli]
MRRSTTTVLVTALAAAAALTVPAQAAAPAVELQPDRLSRGADVAVPHIEDGDFVDGDRRVELPGTVARVVGEVDGGWLVATNNVDRKRNRRLVRVEADGAVVDVLRDIDVSTVILSADGSTLAWQQSVSGGRKTITYAYDVADAAVTGKKGPGPYVSLLDVAADRVVLGAGKRVLQWKPSTGKQRTVVRKLAGSASIEHDLLSVYTKDPYDGGCTKLVRLSKPRVKVWKSCRDRIAAFSPDGTELLTFHILTDGLGPSAIHLREVDGTTLATWTTGWFSGWEWESTGTVLLEVNGKRKSATVRCVLAECENASDPVDVQAP